MIRTMIAAGMAVATAGLAAASIPAPARPPETLPETIAGLPAGEIWYSFSEWARFETVDLVDDHARTSYPPRYSRDGGPELERRGPVIRFGSTFQDSTRISRFEYMCRRADGEGADECYWQFRRISAPDMDVIDGISRDVFDAAAVAAFIEDAGPAYLEGRNNRDFGSADVLRERLRAAVIDRVVTEMDCPAVRTHIEATASMNLVSLNAMRVEGDLLRFDEPLPPPPPLFGASYVFTFPLDAYQDVEGEVVLRGGLTPEIMAFAGQLQGDIWRCFEE